MKEPFVFARGAASGETFLCPLCRIYFLQYEMRFVNLNTMRRTHQLHHGTSYSSTFPKPWPLPNHSWGEFPQLLFSFKSRPSHAQRDQFSHSSNELTQPLFNPMLLPSHGWGELFMHFSIPYPPSTIYGTRYPSRFSVQGRPPNMNGANYPSHCSVPSSPQIIHGTNYTCSSQLHAASQ